MATDVHDPDPVVALLDTARQVVPAWLAQITIAAARRGGVRLAADDAELTAMIEATSQRLLDALSALVRADVDEQRTNPLSLFRAAVDGPTALLQDRGAIPPPESGFETGLFPGDVYRLGPANWTDIDPALQEPGLIWGAWKAATVLRRRREEGLR